MIPEFITLAVRQGVLSMPPFRKTEVTDAELAALGHLAGQWRRQALSARKSGQGFREERGEANDGSTQVSASGGQRRSHSCRSRIAAAAQAAAPPSPPALPATSAAAPSRLPPGVSRADFNKVLAAWRGTVGNDWVFTSDADVNLYRDAYSPYWDEPEERVASAAVAPQTLEQVQAVVRVANQYKVPLYAISTGRNLAYGGSAPVYSGSVVLDLKRMNNVLEVNERNAYALVEPASITSTCTTTSPRRSWTCGSIHPIRAGAA